VLFPDQWISRDSEQRVEVVAAKWAEVEQLAAQNRLKIRGRHAPSDGLV
jgi:uncharacterized protein YciI